MNMDKLVYIIIPVYNVEKYLRKCLESVFSQTYKNIQVICINDGSTDKSLDILNEYKDKHNNLVVIDKPNGGPSGARNEGLKYIKLLKNKNNYLTFIDSDDWVEECYIQTLVGMMNDNGVDVVCSSFLFASNNKYHPYTGNIDNDKELSGLEATRLLLLDETIQSHAWSKLYKTILFDELLYDENIKYMEDQAFTYKLLYKANRVYISNYAGYYYRQDNMDALTKLNTDNKKVLNGLYAYYSVCLSNYKGDNRNVLLPVANNALATAYLTLIPYYNKKVASESDKMFIKKLKAYIKKNKVVVKYATNNKNNKIKKKLYMMCPALYPLTFKMAKRIGK